MGQPVVIVYRGQEIKFCCPDCPPQFNKDPEKYLKKLAAEEEKAGK
jgi:YHS domain-containing protein